MCEGRLDVVVLCSVLGDTRMDAALSLSLSSDSAKKREIGRYVISCTDYSRSNTIIYERGNSELRRL